MKAQLKTQRTSRRNAPAARRHVRETNGHCRCRGAKPVPDLTAFLTLLAPPHLEDLARQCELTSGRKGEDPARQAQKIARFLEEHPDEPIRLRNEPKHAGKHRRSPYSFEKGKSYVLGPFGSSIWNIGIKKLAGQHRRQLSLRDDLLFPIEIDFRLGCALQNVLFGVRLIVEEDVVIPDGVTVVTDLQSIRFERQLTMERDARLYGTHPCGLRLEVDHLSGRPGTPGAPPMEEWPMLSTSIRPLDEQFFNLDLVNEDYSNLWRIASGAVKVHGDDGEAGWYPHDFLEGSKGALGGCDWAGLGGHTDAGDGESHEGEQGLAGTDGGPAGEGHSAVPLTVTVQSTYEGHMRFEARGGNGGVGGRGGPGQSMKSGAGGDVSGWCKPVTKPGLGGPIGTGGGGGRGGNGGNGGNGSTIRLSFPTLPDEKTYRACVRKGSGGRPGANGPEGTAFRGRPGYWLDLFTNEPDTPVETPEDYWQTSSGSVPEPGLAGQEGWNGSIYVNGELEVASNQGNTPNDFRYPVGDIVAGGENECWDG